MYSYTIEQLQNAVKISFSFRQALQNLSLNASGNAYHQIQKNIAKNQIDITHFTGSGWLKGKSHNHNASRIISLDEIFEGKHPSYSINRLRQRLIKEGLKKHQCEICFLTDWLEKPIPIELDHINGNNMDHRFDNLRILCPNCHAQTSTYCGKNKGKMVAEVRLELTL